MFMRTFSSPSRFINIDNMFVPCNMVSLYLVGMYLCITGVQCQHQLARFYQLYITFILLEEIIIQAIDFMGTIRIFMLFHSHNACLTEPMDIRVFYVYI